MNIRSFPLFIFLLTTTSLFSRISLAQTWTKHTPAAYQMWCAWGSADNNVWVTGNNGTFVKYNGTALSTVAVTDISGQRLALWGNSASNVYSGGSSTGQQVLRYDGTSWSKVTDAITLWGSGAVRAIWGSSSNNVLMGGGASGTPSARIMKWNGTTWAYQIGGLPTNFSCYAIWGNDANNIWAGGSTTNGVLYKWNPTGSTWVEQKSGITTIRAIWGSSDTNVWAIGGDGTGNTGKIYRYNGTTWSDVTPAAMVTINGIWGHDASNIWIVGDGGLIMKWDGTQWTAQTSGTTNKLTGIYGVASGTKLWVTADATSDNLLSSTQVLTPMPVKLLTFTARQNEQHITLNWSTTEEVNADRFEVQISSDNLNFEHAGTIRAQEGSIGVNRYQFDFTTAEPAKNYYFRLKMVDKDESFTYSRKIVSKLEANPNILVFPNPATEYIQLTAKDDILNTIKLEIVDMNGKIWVSKKTNMADKISLDNLSTGNYLIRLFQKNEKEITRQFSVQR